MLGNGNHVKNPNLRGKAGNDGWIWTYLLEKSRGGKNSSHE